MSEEKKDALAPEVGTTPASNVPTGKLRNGLIAGSIAVFAAIVFGILYLFVIAPSIPEGGQGWGMGWFLFSFAAGLTMIVLPCTLPLAFVIVPLSMGKGMVRGISMALAFGLGVAVMLSIYGILAAKLGGVAIDALGADLETVKNWVYFVAGSFAVIFAMSEIGLLKFHMPMYSGAAPAFIQKRQEFIKAFLLGLFLGNVGVGCPHPATPLILIEIASSGDVLYGWMMFLVHAIGRVLPLLLLAFLAILGVNGLNWLLARKDAVEKGTGWAMVFVAGFILTLGLFSHAWWVNSGLHSGLETLTQEHRFNALINDTLGTDVAHVHGLEDGEGLFGLPLAWGSWVLVALWLIPIWLWYYKRKKEVATSTDPCEEKILTVKRNFLIVISIFLVLVFAHFLPNNFYLNAISGDGHHDHGGHGSTDHAHAPGTPDNHMHADPRYEGVHAMPDGTIMNGMGEVLNDVHMMPDGSFMRNDGTPIVGTAPIDKGPVFSKETSGLPMATGPVFVALQDGDTYDITASYVQKEVGNRVLRMLAYNGSIPGPFIKVTEGSEVTINFTNNTDIDQTIHSHGLRLDNRFDGVPNVTQDVVPPGASFTYTLSFPDTGVAWYHPHTRDDYGQEMGLYGNYIIDPLQGDYWSPVNREVPLVIDDILIENGQIADFYEETIDHVLLGRFGNTYLINGESDYVLDVETGEVIRFQMTNVSNARTYKLSIPGADMKVVAAEAGRFETEEYKDDVLISPSERLIVEVYFPQAGTYELTNNIPGAPISIASFNVSETEVSTSYFDTFNVARRNTEVKAEFDQFRSVFANREPDKRALLTVKLSGQVDHSAHGHGPSDGMGMSGGMMMGSGESAIQWDDPTNSDSVNTLDNVEWLIVDQATGKAGMGIDDWNFKVGDLVKMRFINDHMAEHVMQHPIHIHGQRFVVLSENGVVNNNMAWKDTALVLPGEYIDVLVEMSNPGVWMIHCHISEHLHANMMFGFRVENADGSAPGDEYRKTAPPMTHTGTTFMDSNRPGMQMPDPNAPTPLMYDYGDTIPENEYFVTSDKPFVEVGEDDFVALTFSDSQGNTMNLDGELDRALTVTFVNSDNSVRFITYPGNTNFPEAMQNIPNTPGFDESMPHSHSSIFSIPNAYAHGEVIDGHEISIDGRSYSVPVRFPVAGNFRGFVEFTLAGETQPRISTFTIEVGTAGFNLNNFGWSDSQKWWILLIVSILLTIPLVYGVRRYVNTNTI